MMNNSSPVAGLIENEVPERREGGGRPPIRDYSEGFYQDKVYTTSTLPIHHERPLVFEIPAITDHVVDMRMMRLYLRFKVVKGDGKPLDPADESVLVAPKSTPLYTLFKDLTVLWNNTSVFSSQNLYPNYTNFLMQIKMDDFSSQAIQYYDDNQDLDSTYGRDKDGHPQRTGYSGKDVVNDWESRASRSLSSLFIEVSGAILYDLIFQKKYLRGKRIYVD